MDNLFSFTIFRGDDRQITLSFTDPDTGDPENIAGWDIWFTAVESLDDGAPIVFQRTTADGDGITITDAGGGIATVDLVPSNTSGLTGVTTLFCDVQTRNTAGKVRTHGTGKIKVLRDVTRAESL